MNTFRVGFRMERVTPSGITGAIDEAYFKGLQDTVNHITSKSVTTFPISTLLH